MKNIVTGITQPTKIKYPKPRKGFVQLPCQPRTLRANSTTANCIPKQTPAEGKTEYRSSQDKGPLSLYSQKQKLCWAKRTRLHRAVRSQRKTWKRHTPDWDLDLRGCSPCTRLF